MTELDDFKQEVATWLDGNCPPSMRRPITTEEMVWGSSRLQFQTEDQKLWFERMRERGWFAPSWPKEYGGGGLNPKQNRVLETEMAKRGCRQPQYNLGVWMLGPVLLEAGTHEQKLEHLVPMMKGQRRWCQGFSEPNAGSDLASLKTSARLEKSEGGEDCYVVNGGKIWTSDGDKADWMYALVRTDSSSKKQNGISFLLIDMKSPGVTVKPIELISGKSSFCQVFFDEVRVPVRQLVGKEGEGWTLGKKLLQHERAAMSKFTEGGAPSADALAVTLQYVDRDADGKLEDAALRQRLAGVLMDAQSFTLTHRRVTEMALARKDVSGPGSIMKLVQTEQEVTKYELLEQAMGLRGLGWDGEDFSAEELDLCRTWLRTKTYTIAGGSSEVQLNIIAKRVLDLPA
ncbi:acyl-CoA dehydrogenase family protein [Diaphorobacter caeni]|uniref:acyl-CoA dehydrogenase family protein n=1 Tax=Diaphorobacter caeni TaxID=2784387 RepID=UPI00188E059B|nr:acyl-CoA dehydrogenase family protein [Diaphorobacter caeni]MBF5004296.1 acyl-CoA dehydrogenase family protein [Diaphorobacter caeni]